GEDEDDDDGHGSEGHRHDHLGEDVGGRVQWGQRQLPAPAQCAFDRDLGAAGGRGHHRPVGGQRHGDVERGVGVSEHLALVRQTEDEVEDRGHDHREDERASVAQLADEFEAEQGGGESAEARCSPAEVRQAVAPSYRLRVSRSYRSPFGSRAHACEVRLMKASSSECEEISRSVQALSNRVFAAVSESVVRIFSRLPWTSTDSTPASPPRRSTIPATPGAASAGVSVSVAISKSGRVALTVFAAAMARISWAGPSATMLPPATRMTRSANSSASSGLWAAERFVFPVRASARISCQKSRRPVTSMPVVGSSRTMSAGSGSSAIAKRRRCFCPPEHFFTVEPAMSAMPARSRTRSTSREESKIAEV